MELCHNAHKVLKQGTCAVKGPVQLQCHIMGSGAKNVAHFNTIYVENTACHPVPCLFCKALRI